MAQHPWMSHAWADLGISEVPGARHSATILAYARRLGATWVKDDETPWCAAFVGACLEKAGVRSTRSLAARSYLDWGSAAASPVPGCVVVLSRGADPAAGHVGFLAGWTDSHVYLLGGNQSNAVTVAAFDRARVLGFRLPPGAWLQPDTVAPPSPPSQPGTVPPPPIPAPPGSTVARPSEPDPFPIALAMVLELEGGWTDDPLDPGGPTNKGITLATFAREIGSEVTSDSYARLKSQLRRIPDDLVTRIYRERYWRPCRAPDLPPALALLHFDTAVNMGVPTAARMLQQALAVEVDGEIGPVTIAAARTTGIAPLLDRYADLRRRRYRSLSTFWRFGRGWLRRLEQVLARAEALAAGNPLGAPAPSSTSPIPSEPGEAPMSDAPLPAPPAVPRTPASPKWWGESLTIWGALLTALTTVAPAVVAAFGIDLSPGLAQQLGRDVVAVVQAVGGLVGTLMTIAGRVRATAPIERRAISVRL